MINFIEHANKLGVKLRRVFVSLLGSEGLFFAVMMLFNGVLSTDYFLTRLQFITPFTDYVLIPWSGLLLGMYLMRENRRGGLSVWALALLVLWLAVPFSMRFGTDYFTMYSTYGYAICFFVFYASVMGRDAIGRERQLDIACAGVCLIAIVLGGTLLYCAWTGELLYSYPDKPPMGVVNGQLQHSTHYNATAMLSVVCMLMSLTGLCRSRKKPYAAVYLLGVVIMALVVVLTQSRTARYAMLAVFALGAWNGLAEYLPIKKTLLRHGAALACALAVLVGGYKLCGLITDAALAHYAGAPSLVAQAIVPSALAQDEEQQTEVMQARSQKVDATFSDRTNIWKNVFKNWKKNPKHMLIGNGSGRTKWMVVENTIHEGSVKVHNAYLHFAAEFGLIGFGLLAAALGSMIPSVLRVFFARGRRRVPGGCALCMLVVAILMTGMMENEPLDVMTPMSMALFFALGQLTGAGSAMKE